MCVKTVFVRVSDVRDAQQIQLLLVPRGCDVDGKQHRPGDDAPNQTDGRCDFQIPQQKERVQGVMIQDKTVGHLANGPDPVE